MHESAWSRENLYRKKLAAELWRHAQRTGVFNQADPLAEMGGGSDGNESDFNDAADEFLAIVDGILGLAQYLPLPEQPSEDARIEALTAIQIGLCGVPRLQKLSSADVMGLMKAASQVGTALLDGESIPIPQKSRPLSASRPAF